MMGWRLPWLTVFGTAFMVGLFAALGPAPPALVYDALVGGVAQAPQLSAGLPPVGTTGSLGLGAWLDRGVDGRAWHWLTGHLVHADIPHLLLNVVAFAALGTLIEQYSRRLLTLALAVGVVAVDAYLALGYPLASYAGFSGVLNTLLVLGLGLLAQEPGYRRLARFTLAIAAIKILVEMQLDDSLVTSFSWQAVPAAHLAGFAAGLVCWGSLLVGPTAALPNARRPVSA